MGYMLNGCDTGGLPVYLIKPMLEKHDIHFLVETGTAGGQSIREAANLFKKCWTIEVIEGRQDIEDAPSNVDFLVGDSAELLSGIIKELKVIKSKKPVAGKQYVLFYLDAHFCGDTPNDTGFPECPLLDEIKSVAEYGEEAIVIIDDARLFFGSPPHPNDPTQWPSICDIFHLLKECFPYNHITITDDYILCIPIHVKETVDKEWRDRFHIRYPSESDKLKGQVKDVYKALINYIQ